MKLEQLQELKVLLSRIVAAGGPVRSHAEHWVVYIGDSGSHVGNNPWCERDSALLIHALKLDARARGWLDTTKWLDSGLLQLTIVHKETWVGRHAEHQYEVIAWCLAWTRAFEGSAPAATESHQLAPQDKA